MAGQVIGLDVGTHAVRAVEIQFGRGQPALRRFGQVALDPGLVVGGEVTDPPAVAAALRRLWKEVGFRSKRVVTGVANPRVVARTVEVPAMPEDELRSALRFQVQDLIPIPVEDALLDYQVLEHVVGEEGQQIQRLLLVAAHRDMIGSLLAALDGAGLRVDRIDLDPFAMVRALHAEGAAELAAPDATGSEAIVGIGAGVTNVVVHEQGVPQFVRTLPQGGATITEAIAAELEIDLEAAEDLKRRADPLSADPDEARAAQIIAGQINPLIEDVRGSLDFHLAQAGGRGLTRVLLTGGGSRLPDIGERLGALMNVPVDRAQPLLGLQLAAAGIPDEVLVENQDVLTVAVGLALSGEPLPGGERRVTLLPVEISSRRAEQRRAVTAGIGVAALAALLIILWLGRGGQVASERERAEEAEAQAARLRQEVAALQDVETLEADVAGQRTVAAALVADEIAWPRLLQEISAVMPNDVWLTAFSGTRGDPGTVTVSGMGFDHTSSARWLLRIGELESIAGLWLPSSALSTGPSGRPLVTFSSNASLTEAAYSERAERFEEGG